MKKVTVSLVSGKKYQQKITNGKHTVISDVDVASGGADAGLNPSEIMLGSLGSCTAMTILMVAANKRWDVKEITVTVTQSDEPDPNKAGKKRRVITEELEVTGNLTQKQLDEIKATAQKCPVYITLTESKRVETLVRLGPTTPPSSNSAP